MKSSVVTVQILVFCTDTIENARFSVPIFCTKAKHKNVFFIHGQTKTKCKKINTILYDYIILFSSFSSSNKSMGNRKQVSPKFN